MKVRRERKDAQEHRRLILQTAQTLFNEHGVHTVSMHQIAKTAGIGQATLYRKYAHKGDLCIDLIQDYSKELMNRIDGYLTNNEQLPPEERLSGILSIWIDAIEEKFELIVTMEARINCEDPRGNFFHTPMYLFLRDKMSALLAAMIGGKSSVDPELMAHAIICSMAPSGYFHIKQEKSYTKEQIKLAYMKMCQLTVD